MDTIECHDLALRRGGDEVLDGITVRVRPGDIVGVLGRNGAGKTSLLETLLGFHAPSRGYVRLWGRSARALSLAEKRRIGFVPQQDELLDGLSGRQQLDLIGSFYPQWDYELGDRLASRWALPVGRIIRGWSLGQRQKLSIVLALCSRPELLVLDEPVASLDPLARAQFLEELTRLAGDTQRCLLFSSHIVGDLVGLVNSIWWIEGGRMRFDGTPGELCAQHGRDASELEVVFRELLA